MWRVCCWASRGRLLNDVWLLDIFDWKEVTGPTSAGARAAVGTVSDDVGAVLASGEGAAGRAATARRVALFWVSLDFSSSPLNPPGRFLHSCSVFFTSANSGSCSIVRTPAAPATASRFAVAALRCGSPDNSASCSAAAATYSISVGMLCPTRSAASGFLCCCRLVCSYSCH